MDRIPAHPHSARWFDLPEHHAKDLIRHALRKVPRKEEVLRHLTQTQVKLGQGVPKHQYLNGGTMEWAYLQSGQG